MATRQSLNTPTIPDADAELTIKNFTNMRALIICVVLFSVIFLIIAGWQWDNKMSKKCQMKREAAETRKEWERGKMRAWRLKNSGWDKIQNMPMRGGRVIKGLEGQQGQRKNALKLMRMELERDLEVSEQHEFEMV